MIRKVIILIIFALLVINCSSLDSLRDSINANKPNTGQFVVTYDSMNATVSANPSATTVVSPASSVGTLPTPPTKVGYDFAGWITSTNGGGTVFLSNTPVTGNLTVYAMWSTVGLEFTLINGEYSVKKGNAITIGNVSIPEYWSNKAITAIGNYAFTNCLSLSNINIPSGVKTIGISAFYYCDKLTNIILPNGLLSIDSSAFSTCSSLKTMLIPNSVTNMGGWAFNYCFALSITSIPSNVKTLSTAVYQFCNGITNVIIPAGITDIKNYAFYGCTQISNVVIPATVTNIEDNAFGSCSLAHRMEIHKLTAPIVHSNAFNLVNSCTLHVPADATGYNIAPWTNTSIFSSIVYDL